MIRITNSWLSLFAIVLVAVTVTGCQIDREEIPGKFGKPTRRKNVVLAFDASPSTVIGYRIRYGTTSGIWTESIDLGISTTGTISNLVVGRTYYFVATAYTDFDESVPSEELAYTIQK